MSYSFLARVTSSLFFLPNLFISYFCDIFSPSWFYLIIFSLQNHREAIVPKKKTEFTGCFRDLKKAEFRNWMLIGELSSFPLNMTVVHTLPFPCPCPWRGLLYISLRCDGETLGLCGGNEVLNSIKQPGPFSHQTLRAAWSPLFLASLPPESIRMLPVDSVRACGLRAAFPF